MTDRHPDDLYDALRDRLADYGQKPPAPLWASIRAQLPAPVATPQLRRRWSRVLLLGLLMAVVGGTFWLWQHTAATGPVAHRTPTTSALGIEHRLGEEEEEVGATTPTPSDAARTNGPQTSASSTSTKRATAAPNAASSPTTTDTYAANTVPAVAADAATSAGPGIANGKQATRAGRGRLAAGHTLAGRAGTTTREPGFGSDRADDEPERSRGTRSVRNKAAGNGAFMRKNTVEHRVRRRTARGTIIVSAASTGSPATRPVPLRLGVVAKSTLGTRTTGITDRNESSETMAEQRMTRTVPTSLTTNSPLPDTTNFSVTAAAETSTVATSRVAASPVALQLSAVPGPFVRAQPDSAYLPKLLVRRWALLVLAGPALTHRSLGSSNLNQATAASPGIGPSSPIMSPDSTTHQLAQQERQSTGFGVQVQASRVLNGRWTISAGLGYQEYTSTVEVTETIANRFMPAATATATSTVTHRDSYKFLTVPVQAHYVLGQAGKRLRYGVVAGAEAAIYLGGSNLQLTGGIKNWNASNSPYRSLNLALTTGLDVRYRLAPRLEVVAQPTVTYFLNPLVRPVSGLPPRYLWGGSALLGLSYHLR